MSRLRYSRTPNISLDSHVPDNKAEAGIDGVEIKEISVAPAPGAGVEILAEALESRAEVLVGQPCESRDTARTSGSR